MNAIIDSLKRGAEARCAKYQALARDPQLAETVKHVIEDGCKDCEEFLDSLPTPKGGAE